MKKYALPSGIVKACSGIVESVTAEPYISHVENAGRVVGSNYALDEKSQKERERLVEAIKLNLINRHEYPFECLARKYCLPVSHSTFKREKMRYCHELARLCGLI